jgi:translin
VLPLCREVIRNASVTIRAIHRHEFEEAEQTLVAARSLLNEAVEATANHSELMATGFMRDAQKEDSEANITLTLVTDKSLPTPEELGVDDAAYLNGMGDAVGELRRYLLDGIRSGDLSRAEELLSAMDDMYSVLVTMDFPDAITYGLRHTTDNVRGILERTRSDLTLIVRQNKLESKLTQFEGKI